ncbi:MAG TPA: tyrosine-type recombinase/integrase [Terriglobales bacterium]|nr:tyrosine-type recombinase/integrase [Terriglobales bacterium]
MYLRNGIFCFRYKDREGRWREKSTGKSKRQDARDEKKRFEKGNQTPTLMGRMTVTQAVDHWLDKVDVSANTLRSYKTNLRAVTRHLGHRKLQSLGYLDLRAYQRRRREEGRHSRTINHEILVLGCVLKAADLWEPLKRYYRPLPVSRKSPRRPPTNEQFNELVARARLQKRWDVAMLTALLAANSSCRPCEIVGLTLGALHLEEDPPYISIRRVTTKTDAGEREIPLNSVALYAVKRLLERARNLGANAPEHYLLPTELARHTRQSDPLHASAGKGAAFDPTQHQKTWRTAWKSLTEAVRCPSCALLQPPVDACRKCEADMRKVVSSLKGLQFYQLRHLAITVAAEQNIPLSVTKALAGHMDEQMTAYYTNAREKAKLQAVEAIAQANPELLATLGLAEGGEGKQSQPEVPRRVQ